MWYAAQFVVPQLAAIVIGALMLLAAWRTPVLARVLYLALFAWACITNFWTVAQRPHVYVEYAPLAVLDVYRTFITGFFAQHTQPIVMAVAACQGLVAFGLAMGGLLARVALVGTAVFLVAIAPLGVGSGFPSTLLMAAGALVLLRRPDALADGILQLALARLGHTGGSATTSRTHPEPR